MREDWLHQLCRVQAHASARIIHDYGVESRNFSKTARSEPSCILSAFPSAVARGRWRKRKRSRKRSRRRNKRRPTTGLDKTRP